MGGRAKCLYTLVVLMSSVLQEGGAMEQQSADKHVNPLLSMDAFPKTVLETDRNRGEAEDLAVVSMERTWIGVQKFMVQKALTTAWTLYQRYPQHDFLRFEWRRSDSTPRYKMWVAFSAEEEIVDKQREHAVAEMVAEPKGALVAVTTVNSTSREPSKCVAAFVIPDEEKCLEEFYKQLVNYVKNSGHEAHGYAYVHTTETWIPDMNPLLSLKHVLEHVQMRYELGAGNLLVKASSSMFGSKEVNEGMFEKALSRAWEMYQKEEQQRFFKFDWTDKRNEMGGRKCRIWIAFSSDRNTVGAYGKGAIEALLKNTIKGLVVVTTVAVYNNAVRLKREYKESLTKAVHVDMHYPLRVYYQHYPHPYSKFVEDSQCVAAYFLTMNNEEGLGALQQQYEDTWDHHPQHYTWDHHPQHYTLNS